MRLWTPLLLLAALALPQPVRADAIEVEWGVSQRVPGGLASVAEGQSLRLSSVSPLAAGDAMTWALEVGRSDVVTGDLRPMTSWLAASVGLQRAFGGPEVPAPFVGAFLDVGLSRVEGGARPGDALFVGGRVGGGFRVPTGPAWMLLAAWLVANDAGPGLSLTVACRFPSPF